MKPAIGLALIGLTINLAANLAIAEEASIKINKMHCGGCVKAVEMNLCKLPGIETCKVEIGSAQITTKAGAKIDQEAIKSSIKAAGYEAAEIKSK